MKKQIKRSARIKRCLGQAGFTLIEVLIGVSILTVGILGVVTMQISAIRGNHFSDSSTTALALAEQKMEDLLSRNFDDAELNNEEPANDNSLDTIKSIDHDEKVDEDGQVNDDGYFHRIWNIADDTPFTANKTITVIVTWRQDRHQVSLTSIKRK